MIIILNLFIVTLAIDFNHQHQFIAEEVYDVIIDGFLAIGIKTLHLFPFQMLPKQNFR